MGVYHGRYPTYVSHTKEVEQLLYFTADLQHRLTQRGQDSGEKFECLLNVRQKCADLLLKMYAEDSTIMLVDATDLWWIRRIVYFVHDVLLKDQRKAG